MAQAKNSDLKQKRGRGRPREFDEIEVMDQAVEVFWDRGYRATTMRELETALEMSQPSIYNAFGSKRELLNLAIDRYESRIDDELFSILSDCDNGFDGITAFFTALEGWLEKTGGRGCLVVNLMTGDIEDPNIEARVRSYREKIVSGFARCLSKSIEDQALIDSRANLLLSTVVGLHLTARTAAGDEIKHIIEGVCTQVAAWRS